MGHLKKFIIFHILENTFIVWKNSVLIVVRKSIKYPTQIFKFLGAVDFILESIPVVERTIIPGGEKLPP